MKPRSQSVFQNYDNFQAWQELPEISHINLLQRLNKNLSSYQNKYKKYMNLRQNQLKKYGPLIDYLEQEDKQTQNNITPFLPQIQAQHNFIKHSLNITKPKILISQQNQTPIEQIFCQRTNNHLKLKTISFNKSSKSKLPFEKRRLSLHEPKQLQVQKFFNKNATPISQQQKQNIQGSPFKVDMTNKMQGYKQLRYRLKKAANKSRMFHDQKSDKIKPKEQKQNIIFQRSRQKKKTPINKETENQWLCTKLNQFSDKKFYQQNIRQRNKLQR